MEAYRRFWEASLDRFEDYVRELKTERAKTNDRTKASTKTTARRRRTKENGNARND